MGEAHRQVGAGVLPAAGGDPLTDTESVNLSKCHNPWRGTVLTVAEAPTRACVRESA